MCAIAKMLKCPTMGCTHEGKKFVYLSAEKAGEMVSCSRNTASADFGWLVKNGFLLRDKLGGKGRQVENGRRVSYSNRGWFYRLGKTPDWFSSYAADQHSDLTCKVLKKYEDYNAGNMDMQVGTTREGRDNGYDEGDRRREMNRQTPVRSDCTVAGQSNKKSSSKKSLLKNGEQSSKKEQPKQPLTGRNGFMGQLQAVGRAVLQAPARAKRGFGTTDSGYQATWAESNKRRQELEDQKYSKPPAGGLDAIRPQSQPVYDRDGFLIRSDHFSAA